MITSLAQALRDLMLTEAAKLDGENISHGPTIGAMYEGLTRDILERAVPEALDLRIVDGFVEGHDGKLSPQMDVMLVTGEGRALPYNAGYVWPVGKVIAVIEVKKNLYAADLEDSFVKLRSVMHMHVANLRSGPAPDLSSAFHAFAMLTGLYPKGWKEMMAQPEELRQIFQALADEQTGPVRVVIGYHGYVDEFSLRGGLVDYLAKNEKSAGFGVTSFPNLIVCGKNALLKLNGQPYVVARESEWWPVVASSDENPLRLLIELIWTRLENEFKAALPPDDSLQMERLARFLSARLVHRFGLVGWEYAFDKVARKDLKAGGPPTQWAPGEVGPDEYVVLQTIAQHGDQDARDENYIRYAKKHGFDPRELLERLVERRILAWVDENTVRLIDTRPLVTGFMPDGTVVTGSDQDMLGLWLEKKLQDGEGARKSSRKDGDEQ